MNTSTDSTGNYSSEFNGFAELISPKSIKAECQAECAFTPSENYASYTDISYNTKPCSRLSTEINDAFVKREPELDMNNSQPISNHFEKSTDENVTHHLPLTTNEIIKQDAQIEMPIYTKLNHEPVVDPQQENPVADCQKVNIVENVPYQPLIPPHSPTIGLSIGLSKVNGNSESAKSDRLTSSLRLIRKPNFRQSSSLLPLIKTKKFSIRLDRSIVDDFLSSQRKRTVRHLQPIVLLKRLELLAEEKRLKASRNGKRKQNRTVWDGETVKDKKTFKRRRDDTDDAGEGSSGFTGGSSGSCYSSDSQSGKSSARDSVDSPPPKSTNGGARDSTEHNCKLITCKPFSLQFNLFID